MIKLWWKTERPPRGGQVAMIFRRCGGRVSYSLPKNNFMLSRICLAVHPPWKPEDAAWVSVCNVGILLRYGLGVG